MNLYLPIAEISVTVPGLLLLGLFAGIFSGLFGVGGGFLTTPFLMFIGIPPAVAVSSSANHVIAASVSGFLSQWRRGQVDFHLGFYLLAGGIIGSSAGVWLFGILKAYGHIDIIITLLYIALLSIISGGMLWSILRTKFRTAETCNVSRREHLRALAAGLPWQTHFTGTASPISLVVPLSIGFLVGVLVCMLGVGGGFLLIPAMVYLLGTPLKIATGTSQFQIMFITANVTLLQCLTTRTVDILLSLLLMIGAVAGVQIGRRLTDVIPAHRLQFMFATLLGLMVIRLIYGITAPPTDTYSVSFL